MTDHTNIGALEELLQTLLKLRYLTLDFTKESYKLRLVSVNAAIASARLGEQGNMFSTLTNEIASLTKKLEYLVGDTCSRINELTSYIASITNRTRNMRYMKEAYTSLSETNLSKKLLYKSFKHAEAENQKLMDSFYESLAKLETVTDELPDYIKFFNAIRTQLVVVIGSIKSSPENVEQGDTDTLRLLADNITSSCQTMDKTLSISENMLDSIQNLLTSNEYENQRVTI